MTAALVLALLGLWFLRRAVRDFASGHARNADLKLRFSVLAWLPMCFGPMTSVSYIVFEVTPDWLFWTGLLLWLSLAASTLVRLRSLNDETGKLFRTSILLSLLFWLSALAFGIPVFGHETGPTPTLRTSPLHFATWLMSCATVVMLIAAIYLAGPRKGALQNAVPAALVGLFVIVVGASF